MSEKSVIIILASCLVLAFVCPSWRMHCRTYFFFYSRNLHYSAFALGHLCPNIHTYTHAVYKQLKTHKNASGSCHNRPPMMEWCLINRRLAAKEWRYLSHFYWAMVTNQLLLNKYFPPWSIAQAHPNWKSSCFCKITNHYHLFSFLLNMLSGAL